MAIDRVAPDRQSSDADLYRAVRGFAQRVRGTPGRATNRVHSLIAGFDAGTDMIAVTDVRRVPVSWDCEIIEWMILADIAGTLGFDISVCTFGSYPAAASIVGGVPCSLAGGVKNRSEPISGLAGWTTLLRDGDVLIVRPNGTPTVHSATLAIRTREV